MPNNAQQLKKKIRTVLAVFLILLLLSGITAFPLQWELHLLHNWFGNGTGAFSNWINHVFAGLDETLTKYPYLSYGTDWLAFAHIVIASAFIGPWMDPVRNVWVLKWGILACILVFPLAFICGPIREIPFFWQLIDCSFGLLGMIPLYYALKWTRELTRIEQQTNFKQHEKKRLDTAGSYG
jgi:hypothetical protein